MPNSTVLRFKARAQAVTRLEGELVRVILTGFKAAPDGGDLDIADDAFVYRFVCSANQHSAQMGRIGPVTDTSGVLTVHMLLAGKLEQSFIDGAESVRVGDPVELEVIAEGTTVSDFLVRPRG